MSDDFEIRFRNLGTIQQSIGIGLDLMMEPNSARKHVGNRFEELIRVLLSTMNIPNKKIVLSIPYETAEGKNIIAVKQTLLYLHIKQ